MYQVAAKFAPDSASASTLLSFNSREDRLCYVEGPYVYWYVFADDIDFGDVSGTRWVKGGAWDVIDSDLAYPEPDTEPERDRW